MQAGHSSCAGPMQTIVQAPAAVQQAQVPTSPVPTQQSSMQNQCSMHVFFQSGSSRTSFLCSLEPGFSTSRTMWVMPAL